MRNMVVSSAVVKICIAALCGISVHTTADIAAYHETNKFIDKVA